MVNNEKFEIIDNVKITYKYQARKYDNNHLIFVFSGFGGDKGITYDFENVLEFCPAHIIWIKDNFEGACTYYWCNNMDFSYENALSKFINLKINELNLTKDNCTVTGFSKGGSAALYYGIKHNIKNIVVTVPQFYVGSYVAHNWNRIARHMMGNVSESNISILDNKLLNIIEEDEYLDKNIYLISSEADIQYSTEVRPNVEKFSKYRNFNLLMSKSLLVSEHKQVTPYHVPLLLGIFYSISQGAIPSYGFSELLADMRKADVPKIPKPISVLKRLKLLNTFFFPEGLAFMKGVPCAKYGDISTKLIFRSKQREIFYNLAKDHKPRLTKDLYETAYVNYDKAWFCTLKYKGLDLSDILNRRDVYKLSIYIHTNIYDADSDLIVNKKLEDSILEENEYFKVFSIGNQVYFEVK